MKRAVNAKEFGARVAARRRKRGLSQGELGELIGMSQQGVASIEKGESERPRLMQELTAALMSTQDWLKYGEGPEEILPPDPKATLRTRIEQMSDSEAAALVLRLDQEAEKKARVA